MHRSCKSALIHRLFCTQPVYHYGKYRYPQAKVLGARIAVSDAVLSPEARRSRGTVRSDASLARGGRAQALHRTARDKIDPLVVVFSEIKRCQNPQFTQVVQNKSKKRLRRDGPPPRAGAMADDGAMDFKGSESSQLLANLGSRAVRR